jgi:DeoR/GlpR family transcriptional regulator of sugar metabolism
MSENNNLLKLERHGHIQSLIANHGRVTVQELSSLFGVSDATIRRDLEELAGQGQLLRTHGGAIKMPHVSKELPMMQRITENSAVKARIGKAAAGIIRDGETIFLGSGTTVIEVARHLSPEINLTVITNSLPVVNELTRHPGIELIVIGGMLRQSELSMVGHVAELAVREFRADRVFLGMYAIDVHSGFTNDFPPEISTDRAILSIAKQVVVLADHSKFNRVSSMLIAPVTAAHLVICDQETPESTVDQLQELGIQVRLI